MFPVSFIFKRYTTSETMFINWDFKYKNIPKLKSNEGTEETIFIFHSHIRPELEEKVFFVFYSLIFSGDYDYSWNLNENFILQTDFPTRT